MPPELIRELAPENRGSDRDSSFDEEGDGDKDLGRHIIDDDDEDGFDLDDDEFDDDEDFEDDDDFDNDERMSSITSWSTATERQICGRRVQRCSDETLEGLLSLQQDYLDQ